MTDQQVLEIDHLLSHNKIPMEDGADLPISSGTSYNTGENDLSDL
jgi:hypothetical protein